MGVAMHGGLPCAGVVCAVLPEGQGPGCLAAMAASTKPTYEIAAQTPGCVRCH
jgi:hypothetical protein